MKMTGTEEVIFAVAAALLLGTATFGMNGKLFRGKRADVRPGNRPKPRIRYLIEEIDPGSDELHPEPGKKTL
jgi:hypothetical protein